LRAKQHFFAFLCIAALAMSLSACGESDNGSPDGAAQDGSASGPQHIHGLGINPADGSLMIATHAGLFRAPAGAQRASRVGDRWQDTMGFTVVGPDRFLGSGHPDLQDDLPPLLGLIRSTDAGKNWTSVSLLGEADFHVLRASDRRIYGLNATDGRLYVSSDRGRTWSRRAPPAATVDLVPAPDDADHLVASTERGVFASPDAGQTWSPGSDRRAGLVAWPARDALFLVDGRGTVHRSADAGATWKAVGHTGGQPAAFAANGAELYVALHTNEVKVSRDGGRSWDVRVAA
jgi:photosystem II stability/assembly factor-like uncharacterized protein